jgi:hypothetical protein
MKINNHKRHTQYHQRYSSNSSPNYEAEKKVLLVNGENGLGEVEVTPTYAKLNVGISKNLSFVNDYGSTQNKLRVSPVPMLHLPHHESKTISLSMTSKKTNNGSTSSFAKRSFSVSNQLLSMEGDQESDDLIDKGLTLSDELEQKNVL